MRTNAPNWKQPKGTTSVLAEAADARVAHKAAGTRECARGPAPITVPPVTSERVRRAGCAPQALTSPSPSTPPPAHLSAGSPACTPSPLPRRRASPTTPLGLWPSRSELQEVVPNLWITNFFGAKNWRKLAQVGIDHVLICADELPAVFADRLVYLRLAGLTDNTTTALLPHLELALPFIDDVRARGGRVLLHCASGSSRSGAVLVAYLTFALHLSVDQALAAAQAARPLVQPNSGFIEQLHALAAHNFFAGRSRVPS